ncbi:uncharacterized protein [Antedon mediterranea]|uniref:uncharacterized protein n=1 Tax=Antedon mediterranea TaxID=105859 RepID=UPI003AF74D67
MSRKINYSDLERENVKLAQDIDEIEQILAVHKKGRTIEDNKNSTRTSIWKTGGEGQLSGFKAKKSVTHKVDKPKLKQKKTQENDIQQNLNRQLNDEGNIRGAKKPSLYVQASKHHIENDQEVFMTKPHGSNTSRCPETRREWKRMQPRKVSFDLDDEDSEGDSQNKARSTRSDLFDPTDVIKKKDPSNSLENIQQKGSDLGAAENKIAALKVKVLAKASSKVKLEIEKKKTDGKNKLKESIKISKINSAAKSSNMAASNELKEIPSDTQVTQSKNDISASQNTKWVDEIKVSGQPLQRDPISTSSPQVLAWLENIHLDKESYSKLFDFIEDKNIKANKLSTMTKADLTDLGFNDTQILSLIFHKDNLEEKQDNDVLFTKTDNCDKIKDAKDSRNSTTTSTSKKVRPQSAKNTLKKQLSTNKKARPSSATERTSQQQKSKNVQSSERCGSLLKDSAVIASKTGVSKASHKLKSKQDQEEQMKRKKEKEAVQRKTERDKMAALHQKRLDEKVNKVSEKEVYEDIVGAPESQNIYFSLVAQGISPPESSKNQESSSVDKITPSIGSCEPNDSAKQLRENQLKKIELQVISLQDNLKVGDSSVEENILRLQKQLSDLQRELHTQPGKESSRSETAKESSRSVPAKESSRSAVKGSSPGKEKKTKKPSDTLHSRTELMREVRRQKEQHRKEIRVLESELSRLKHRDPVKTCELSQEDITFSEEDIIGEGAFSQVFHGMFNGSEVAIKRLKHSLSSSDKNYFAEEVNLLHGLRHPRIVLLIGVCTTGKLPLMVLEYMSAGSLYQYLHNRNMPRLDHVSFYRISKDIALGMTYLHHHKPPVLHLDLKSLNILLNGYGRAKIADFGFSKLKHEAEEVSSGLRGTPAWMAPELLDPNLGALSIKADVYSFGVILWEMLTRETPYKGVSTFQILEGIRTSKRPEIPDYCPGALRGLITRCWKQKASQRPSFKEILISLEGLQLPLEWRSLLSKAGIPHEVMEEPESARSIITLINQSVDISVHDLNEFSLRSHDEFIYQSLADQNDVMHTEQAITDEPDIKPTAPIPPPILNLAKFIEKQTKTSKARPVQSPRVVSKSAISSKDDQPPGIPAKDLIDQKLMLKSTIRGPHPSQLANLNNITEQKFKSIAEVLRQSVNNRRFAMKIQSVEQSTLDSNWSLTSN